MLPSESPELSSCLVQVTMACVKFVILVVLVSLCKNVHSSPVEGKAHYCSKNLSDALSLICRDLGGYQEPFSSDNFASNDSKGIVEECCKKPCSVYQLSFYCKDSRPLSETAFGRRLYSIVSADDPSLLTNRLTIRE